MKTIYELQNSELIQKEFKNFKSIVPKSWEKHVQKQKANYIVDYYTDKYDEFKINLIYADTLDLKNCHFTKSTSEFISPRWAFERLIKQFQKRPDKIYMIEKAKFIDDHGILFLDEEIKEDSKISTFLLEFMDWYDPQTLLMPCIQIVLRLDSIISKDGFIEICKWRKFFLNKIIANTGYILLPNRLDNRDYF